MTDFQSFTPKYYLIIKYLEKLIIDGETKGLSQLPSENDLVKHFKVSRQTVRQAIRELEARGWLYREQGRGTFIASREKRKAQKIALMTTFISDYIFPSFIRGVEEVLSEAGYILTLFSTANNKNREAQNLDILRNQEIAGLIIEPTRSAEKNINKSYFKELEKKRIPYIFIHATYSDLDPAYVVLDDEKGMYLATKYLIQLGHREIAGLFKTDDMQGINRQNGFMKALQEQGIICDKKKIGDFETRHLASFPYHFTKELLLKKDRPTAIVCFNDWIAIRVMQAIRDFSFKIPTDISVVGFDDSVLAVASEIKLTTINHPKEKMGQKAAKMLIDMINLKVEKPRYIFEPELIVRNSCSEPKISDHLGSQHQIFSL